MDDWDNDSWEPKQKEQKTIYSQSFSRGRGNNRGQDGGNRGNRDRNSDGNYRQNRRDNNSGGYGRNQNDSYGKSDNYQRGNRFNDDDNRESSGGGYGRSQGGSSKTITVETRNLGRVIGRGGSKIKQLEQDSGARINVSENDHFHHHFGVIFNA